MVFKNSADSENNKITTAIEMPKEEKKEKQEKQDYIHKEILTANADLSFILNQISEYGDSMHKKNQKRIKAGLWCIAIVPLFFLFLLFKMNSSKVVYLLLWVISLFIISAYLITVAYIDYSLQERLKAISLNISSNNHSLDFDNSALISSNVRSILEATKEIRL